MPLSKVNKKSLIKLFKKAVNGTREIISEFATKK